MDLQTAAMLEQAGTDRLIEVGKHKKTGLYHGMLFVNHPTPSGSKRYLLALSDNRGWPDKHTAKVEFEKSLAEAGV